MGYSDEHEDFLGFCATVRKPLWNCLRFFFFSFSMNLVKQKNIAVYYFHDKFSNVTELEVKIFSFNLNIICSSKKPYLLNQSRSVSFVHVDTYVICSWTWATFNLKYDCDIINDNLIEPEVLTNTVCLSQQTLELSLLICFWLVTFKRAEIWDWR